MRAIWGCRNWQTVHLYYIGEGQQKLNGFLVLPGNQKEFVSYMTLCSYHDVHVLNTQCALNVTSPPQTVQT